MPIKFTDEFKRDAVSLVESGIAQKTACKDPDAETPRFWTTARIIGAAVVGLATVVGTVVAILQLPLWS